MVELEDDDTTKKKKKKRKRLKLDELIHHPEWKFLTSKTYLNPNFQTYKLSGLIPGSKFSFVIRYQNPFGWSEISLPSPIYKTLSCPPSPPTFPPLCSHATSNMVSLFWGEGDGNGMRITGYVVEGKCAGGEFEVVFKGCQMSCIVSNLQPSFSYIFHVAAENKMGIGEFGPTFSILLPEEKAESKMSEKESFGDLLNKAEAEEDKNQWIECWDHKTEQMFYFNKVRELEIFYACDIDKYYVMRLIGWIGDREENFRETILFAR